ncbi:hypothetical protein KDA_38880 [Dictyobacter alpinus]|uniref:Uncharacterized protein n=1 Tax=Dictyobacter alpinus TaxID=2014873 RepID=A0A402BAN1_9CHLR|nr:hypothetical protein [Dictyobacter alpinus]GCE28404.1 hypothetical protein KDA_38880 [Dictyobacter alpinus]
MAQLAQQTVHVRVNGRSEELPFAQLGIAQNSTDSQFKDAVARYLDLPTDSLTDHVIVRTTQAIIIRPEALYG